MQPYIDPWRLGPRPGAQSTRLVRDLFVRGLGLVHLMAFVSLWVQIIGLVGSRGLLPAVKVAAIVQERWGWSAAFKAPSLFWLWPSDWMLHGLCGAGVALSLLVLLGRAQGPALVGLWALYLSVYYAGQAFLSYQWDLLLIETTFVALLVAPWQWKSSDAPEPSPLAMTVLRLLVFKLMVLSGLVKVWSGDVAWSEYTALTWHYWTQPLPNPVSWWADRLPLVVHKVSAALTLGIEIVLPWALFAGRRGRLAFFAGTATLMGLLGVSGNFGFFQPLTLVLAIALLDDDAVLAVVRRVRGTSGGPAFVGTTRLGPSWRPYVVGTVATVLIGVNAMALDATFRGPLNLPKWEQRALTRAWPWRSANSYGLFAVMTKERPEIVLEGTTDGVTWREIPFRWKPGDVDRAPPIVAPHLPRLDWQMWFAAFQRCDENPWVPVLMDGILEGRPEILALLGPDPFGDERPVQVRATVWSYTFAEAGSDAWWSRVGPLAEYCPARSR